MLPEGRDIAGPEASRSTLTDPHPTWLPNVFPPCLCVVVAMVRRSSLRPPRCRGHGPASAAGGRQVYGVRAASRRGVFGFGSISDSCVSFVAMATYGRGRLPLVEGRASDHGRATGATNLKTTVAICRDFPARFLRN